jgi:hypothetical protein
MRMANTTLDRADDPGAWEYPDGSRLEPAGMVALKNAFNHSRQFENLSPWEDAVSGIKRLVDEHGVYIIAVTACGTDPDVIVSRRRNLDRVFGGRIHEVYHTNGDKTDQLRSIAGQMDPSDPLWFIDDYWKSVVQAREVGFRTIQMRAPNARYDDRAMPNHTLTHWMGIANVILGGI